MMDYTAVLITCFIFGAIVILVKIISDNHLRNKMLEKGIDANEFKKLQGHPIDFQLPSSLKWGMVLIGIGIAFIIGQVVPHHLSEEMTVAGIFILSGLGFIIYYLHAKKSLEKKN